MRDLSKPTVPSTAIQRRMAQETADRKAAAAPAPGLAQDSGAPEAARRALENQVEALRAELLALSHDLHDNPEVGYQEVHAAQAVADLLRAHGLEPEVGVFGMETAVRAEFGTGSPTMAILAEYDALPGIGHGCGHNVMAANSVGAFLALYERFVADPPSVPGRVILQTTPAEECDTAKERLCVAGMLDGVDAAIQTHSYNADLVHQTWLGVRRMRIVFTGVPAHASSQPFMGRNALDAATLTLTGIGMLRQQILPMDRIHAVVVDGGQVANIIPERTELSLFVRSKYPETLKDIVARVEDVVRGAALMTGTGVEIVTPDYTNEMPVRTNGPLAESWVRAERERGREPLPFGIVPENIAAGTDFGNVSLRVPGIHPLIKVAPEGVALHTREMTAAGATAEGDAACIDGAYGLACVALDYLSDPQLQARVAQDFADAGGVVDVAHLWDE